LADALVGLEENAFVFPERALAGEWHGDAAGAIIIPRTIARLTG